MSQEPGFLASVRNYLPGMSGDGANPEPEGEEVQGVQRPQDRQPASAQGGGGILSYIPGFGSGNPDKVDEDATGTHTDAPRTTRSGTVYNKAEDSDSPDAHQGSGHIGGLATKTTGDIENTKTSYNEDDAPAYGSKTAKGPTGGQSAGYTQETDKASYGGPQEGGNRNDKYIPGSGDQYSQYGHDAQGYTPQTDKASYGSSQDGGNRDAKQFPESGGQYGQYGQDHDAQGQHGHPYQASIGQESNEYGGSAYQPSSEKTDYSVGEKGGALTEHAPDRGHSHSAAPNAAYNLPGNAGDGADNSQVKGTPIEGDNLKGYAVSAPVGSGDVNVRPHTGDPSGQVSGAHTEYGPVHVDDRDQLGRGTVGKTTGEGDSSFANVKRTIDSGTEHVTSHQSHSRVSHSSTTQL